MLSGRMHCHRRPKFFGLGRRARLRMLVAAPGGPLAKRDLFASERFLWRPEASCPRPFGGILAFPFLILAFETRTLLSDSATPRFPITWLGAQSQAARGKRGSWRAKMEPPEK